MQKNESKNENNIPVEGFTETDIYIDDGENEMLDKLDTLLDPGNDELEKEVDEVLKNIHKTR